MSVRMVATVPSKKAGRLFRLRRRRSRVVAHENRVWDMRPMERLHHLMVCEYGNSCPYLKHLR